MNALGKLLVFAALGMTAVFSTAASAQNGPRGPNVLIVGEDADKDTIPRGSVNFNRIERALAEKLIERGFTVYDETAITMDVAPQGGVRRELPELLQMAKIAKVPIEVIVVFQIYANVRPMPYMKNVLQPFVRVDGRLIRVRPGQVLGNFEYGSDIEFEPLPQICRNADGLDRTCVLESFGNQARLIGEGVGKALATKLASYLRADTDLDPNLTIPGGDQGGSQYTGNHQICEGMHGTSYVLRIRNFTGAELQQLEKTFTTFACYEHHRVLREVGDMIEYAYESRANQARIVRNLRFVLEEHLNLEGSISVTDGGTTIVVDKHTTPPHGVQVYPPR